MKYAYLDSSGNVLATASIPVTVEDVQQRVPEVVSRVDGAPDEITPRIEDDPEVCHYHRKTSGDGTDISHYTTVSQLDALKYRRYLEVDAVDKYLIDQGYEFPPGSGLMLSLSNNAQKNLIALAALHEWEEFTLAGGYPISLSYRDDANGKLEIPDGSTFRQLALTAFNTISTIVGEGDMLKAAIRSASTKQELDGVVDERVTPDKLKELMQSYD